MSGGLPINLPLVGSSGSAVLQSLGTLGAGATFTFSASGNVAYDGTLSVGHFPTIVASAAGLYGEMVLYIHQPVGATFGLTLPINVFGAPSSAISIPSGNIARIVLACEAGLIFFVSATNFVAQMATTVGTFTVGFNWSGMETNGGVLPGVAGTDYAILTDAEMAYYSAKGLLLNRLPILWERIQPKLGMALDTGYLGHITDALTLAAKYGAKFVVDIHNFGGYGGNVLGAGSLTGSNLADLWTRLATALKGHAGLGGYDVMNEPHDLGPAGSTIATQDGIWTAAVQAVVTAINGADSATDIYVEGLDYSDAFLFATNNPTLHTVTSSGNRIIYEAHSYLDRDSSGTNFIWATEVAAGDVLTSPVSTLDTNIGVKRINPFVSWCLAHGKLGFLGEVGVGRDVSAWNDALRNTMTRAKAAGLGLTYWCGGSGYASYPEGITPTNGIDTNQMAVLCEFTGVTDAPTLYTVTGPNRGAVSAASGAFLVLIEGRIATAGTITPASSVSGVTFTPASLSVPVGDNFAGTFFVNAPATAAAIKISFSNTLGLTNPPALGYSTITDLFVGLGAEPTNVWWPTLLYTPYAGSAVTLQRQSDNTQQAFGFNASNAVDQASIASWSGSTNPLVVDVYDQGPGARHMIPVFSDNTSGPVVNGAATALATSAADYPTFVPSAYNSLPAARFATSRMDAHSPLDGSKAITVFLAVKPTSLAGAQYMMSWAFVQRFVLCGDASGDWEMSGETTTDVSLDIDPTVAHVYAVTWGGGGSRTVWRDGSVIATSAATETSLVFAYRDAVNFGYFRFYPTFAAFDLIGAIVLPVVPTAAQIGAFFNRLCGDLAIPQVGASGAMTVTATAVKGFSVSIATPPANATSITLQYRLSGTTAWTTAGSVAVSGTGAQTYTYTGLTAGTAYDLAGFGTNGGYAGPTTVLLNQSTAATPGVNARVLSAVGVNVAGGENSPNAIFAPASKATYYTGKGFKVIRLCFDWAQAQPGLTGAISSSYWTSMDPFITAATQAGATVLLDCHNYGSSSVAYAVSGAVASGATSIVLAAAPTPFANGAGISGTGIPSGCTVSISGSTLTLSTATTAAIASGASITLSGSIGTTITNAAFASLWTGLCGRYGSNALVVPSLQNEPGVAAAALASAYTAAIQAWRAAESAGSYTVRTIYGCVPGSNATGIYNSSFIKTVLAADSASNFAFEGHYYNDSNGSGTSGTTVSTTIGVERLAPAIAAARYYGAKMAITEFAAGDDATGLGSITNEMMLFQKNADIIPLVTWWGGGDFASVLDNGYYYGIEPSSAGKDTPFIAPLQAFMSGGSSYGKSIASPSFPLTANSSATTFVALTGDWAGHYGLTGAGAINYGTSFITNPELTLEAWVNIPTAMPTGQYANYGFNLLGNSNVCGLRVTGNGNLAGTSYPGTTTYFATSSDPVGNGFTSGAKYQVSGSNPVVVGQGNCHVAIYFGALGTCIWLNGNPIYVASSLIPSNVGLYGSSGFGCDKSASTSTPSYDVVANGGVIWNHIVTAGCKYPFGKAFAPVKTYPTTAEPCLIVAHSLDQTLMGAS